MALAHPERVQALIVQNAVAHNTCLGPIWKVRCALWENRSANEQALCANLFSLETTRARHVGHHLDVQRYHPDLWTDGFAFLNRPGQADSQADLFYDYRTNVAASPTWQAWLRQKTAEASRGLGKARPLI